MPYFWGLGEAGMEARAARRNEEEPKSTARNGCATGIAGELGEAREAGMKLALGIQENPGVADLQIGHYKEGEIRSRQDAGATKA